MVAKSKKNCQGCKAKRNLGILLDVGQKAKEQKAKTKTEAINQTHENLTEKKNLTKSVTQKKLTNDIFLAFFPVEIF